MLPRRQIFKRKIPSAFPLVVFMLMMKNLMRKSSLRGFLVFFFPPYDIAGHDFMVMEQVYVATPLTQPLSPIFSPISLSPPLTGLFSSLETE